MARIAGVDIPRDKRVDVSLTYIFGIGRPTAQKILGTDERQPGDEGPRPDRRRGQPPPRGHRQELHGRGRPAPRGGTEHPAADRDQQVPRRPPPPRPARPRAAHEDQRAPRRGPRRTVGAGARSDEVRTEDDMAERKKRSKQRRREKKNVPRGHALIQSTFNNTIITLTDPNGRGLSLGLRRHGRLQGFAQEHAVRRRASPRRPPRAAHGAWPAPGRGPRQGPRHRPRGGDPLAAGAGPAGTSIRDVTPIPHNGCRPPKRRRV